MMSDDSENDGAYVERVHENNIYYKKYKLLLEECEVIQKNNEKLVFRIEEVKKITKRRLEHINYIKDKLRTNYGEDWEEIPQKEIKVDEDEEMQNFIPLIKQIKDEIKDEHKSGIKTTSDKTLATEEKVPAPTPPVKPPKKTTKRKSTKAERDPNAPKRPSNPFFQFCQEQRQVLMETIISELKPGEVEPSKQELTRQLALKWKTLSTTDKQIYVDMYERSKEKYAAEMSEYNMKK